MDGKEEILEFATKYAKDFPWAHSPIHILNWANKDPKAWAETKRFILSRNAPTPEDERRAPNGPSVDMHVTETVRRMKTMYAAGSSVEEIISVVPCWLDDSGWSYDAVERIVTGQQPRWHQMAETFGLWPGVKAA